MRLDLYLKACLLVKRRTVARQMCEAGRVLVNGHEAKPAKEIRPTDRVTLLFSAKRIELEVLALPLGKSVARADATSLYRVLSENRTEREEFS